MPSPFTKMLVLGFYDGPISGIVQCEACSTTYAFDMMDWNEDHSVRVFRLAALPSNALAECTKALAATESPCWPVWFPWSRQQPSATVREAVDRKLQEVIQRAESAELLVAWSGYGESILTARRVPSAELKDVPDWFSQEDPRRARDWLAFLGLSRDD